MLQNKQNILLVLVIVLIGYNIFTTNSIRTDVKGYEARIESVQTKIDSAQVINKQIDVKIDSVKENVVSITKEIHHIDNTITIVKKQTDEKTNTVDKFSNPELEFFFTNRYNENNSTN
jgi:septal ring factor EnvC (AmiA/AmiB activator)